MVAIVVVVPFTTKSPPTVTLFVVVNDCKVISSSCFNSSFPILLSPIVKAPPPAIVASPLTFPKISSSKFEKVIFLTVPGPVSYTHLTLPTNREV